MIFPCFRQYMFSSIPSVVCPCLKCSGDHSCMMHYALSLSDSQFPYSSSSSSSSSSRRTDRWVHFQQNAGLWLFVHTWIVHGIDDRYKLTRTFGGFSAQCLSKLFLKEFTVLLVTTSFGRAFQVVVILIGSIPSVVVTNKRILQPCTNFRPISYVFCFLPSLVTYTFL